MKKHSVAPIKVDNKKKDEMTKDDIQYAPPDGGYGWLIVLGASIVMVSTRSAEPSFGLLFGDFLHELGVETTGAAVIMNAMDAVMNFSGLIVAPLIRTYSYRKVSLIGSILCTLSILLTVPAKSFVHIVLTFSVIGGIGAGLAISATFVAINTFFNHRKGMAVGFSMAGTGVGLLVMPTTIRLLLDSFGFRGTVLLLAGFTMHSLVGSCLLRPFKWYRKVVPPVDGELSTIQEEAEVVEDIKTPTAPIDIVDEKIESPLPSVDFKGRYGLEIRPDQQSRQESRFQIGEQKIESTTIVVNEVDFCVESKPQRDLILPRNFSVDAMHEGPWKSLLNTGRERPLPHCRKESTLTIDTVWMRRKSIVASSVDLSGSTFHIPGSLLALDGPEKTRKKSECKSHHIQHEIIEGKNDALLEKEEFEADSEVATSEIESEDSTRDSSIQRFVRLMDLDLLRDPVFINILVGMSFFWVAEVNYRMIVPFFLSDLGYSKGETATVLTVIAAADILSRIVLPPLIDRTRIKRRTVFFVTSVLLALARSTMAEMKSWVPLLSCAIVGGFLRGTTLINFQLTIAESCSLDKLPAAYGLSMVFKGIFIVALGPLIGVVRDATGSYPLCLHVQTLLIMVCFIAWSVEFLATKYCRRGHRKMGG